MVARRAIRMVNAPASAILVRPFVVMAARVLGPGPTRLWLVKLAHNLGPSGALTGSGLIAHDDDGRSAIQDGNRAAQARLFRRFRGGISTHRGPGRQRSGDARYSGCGRR